MQQSALQNQPKFPLVLAAGCPLSSPWRWSFILASFSSNNHNVHLCQDKYCKIHSLAIHPSLWGATVCPVPQVSHPFKLLFSKAAFRSKWACVNREGCLIRPHLPTACPQFLVHFAQHFFQKLRNAFYEEMFQWLKPVQNVTFITGQFHCNLKYIYFWPTYYSAAYRGTK